MDNIVTAAPLNSDANRRSTTAACCRWMLLAALPLVLGSTGCNGSSPDFALDDVEKLKQEFGRQSEISASELKKLRQLEYKVLEFPASITAQSLAQHLSEIGSDRWDCFSVVPRTRDGKETLFVTCKRQVGTPLRWIPRTILNH